MKRKKIIIASILCLITVSGFCSGKKETNTSVNKTDISDLEKRIDTALTNSDKSFREINERLSKIEENLQTPNPAQSNSVTDNPQPSKPLPGNPLLSKPVPGKPMPSGETQPVFVSPEINENSIPVQDLTASVPDENDTRTVTGNDNHPGDRQRQSPPVDAGHGPIKIEGKGSLSKPAIVEYIMKKNCNISRFFLERLIDIYIREAAKEGINHDLAIAQMCRTTNFLKKENILQTCNYAGFNTTPGWPGRFRGVEEGVIAHIQHLKGYTSNVSGNELKEPLVDPRWNMLNGFRGTIHTLEGLAKMWSPHNTKAYEDGIKQIIEDMRRHFS